MQPDSHALLKALSGDFSRLWGRLWLRDTPVG